MSQDSQQPKGQSVVPAGHTWVQTERKAHEAWGRLAVKNPRASAMLHQLVALMGSGNVVVVSMPDLAAIMGCTARTLYRAADDLIDDGWIQRIKVSGRVYGFAVNAEVAWAGFRGAKFDAGVFSANVVAPMAELQSPPKKLRRVPLLFPPEERALAMETGGEPGSQTQFPGMEMSVEVDRSSVVSPPETEMIDMDD